MGGPIKEATARIILGGAAIILAGLIAWGALSVRNVLMGSFGPIHFIVIIIAICSLAAFMGDELGEVLSYAGLMFLISGGVVLYLLW